MTQNQQVNENPNAQGFPNKPQQAAEQLKNAAVEQAEKVRSQADSAKDHAVERIRRVGSALKSAGDELRQQDEFVADYAARAAAGIDRVAEYLTSVPPRELVHDAEQFARRKPALFFGGAFLVGLAAGRFLRASSSSLSSSPSSNGDEDWQASNDSPLVMAGESSSAGNSKQKSSRKRSPARDAGGSEPLVPDASSSSTSRESFR